MDGVGPPASTLESARTPPRARSFTPFFGSTTPRALRPATSAADTLSISTTSPGFQTPPKRKDGRVAVVNSSRDKENGGAGMGETAPEVDNEGGGGVCSICLSPLKNSGTNRRQEQREVYTVRLCKVGHKPAQRGGGGGAPGEGTAGGGSRGSRSPPGADGDGRPADTTGGAQRRGGDAHDPGRDALGSGGGAGVGGRAFGALGGARSGGADAHEAGGGPAGGARGAMSESESEAGEEEARRRAEAITASLAEARRAAMAAMAEATTRVTEAESDLSVAAAAVRRARQSAAAAAPSESSSDFDGVVERARRSEANSRSEPLRLALAEMSAAEIALETARARKEAVELEAAQYVYKGHGREGGGVHALQILPRRG
ncbi:hypothetical protein Esi_0211_0005 [Ectocarpus siliculosus]|uniref:Uncharacterized protein n=1 Tax=Ectocarpus siliculosus TaxID=2880 RepID=D7FR65_ECTSI|nr:hypothetical protein Esi_0211_0005 [Ectocarpus siliculosus]|eukprot:CBJ49190.1 hypothetical protein Esi_0211_0005 [Ectocarpus siliculosus]